MRAVVAQVEAAGDAERVVEAEAVVEGDVDPLRVETCEVDLPLDQLDDLAVVRVARDVGAEGVVRLRHVGVIALQLDVAVRIGVDRVLDADVVIIDRDRQPLRETRSEEQTSELQSLMRISYAVFCLKKKTQT